MSDVYKKLGLFGYTYWHDDGLFVKKITKKKYIEILIKSTITHELDRQLKRGRKTCQMNIKK